MLRAIARVGTGPIQKRVINAPSPAAGANFSFRVPGGKAWQLLAVRATFAASAQAANRDVVLTLNDGTGLTSVTVPTVAAITAGLTRNITWANVGVNLTGTTTAITLPLPSPWYMLPDETVVITVGSIDAGDQLSGVRIVVLETNTGDTYAAYDGAHAMRDHLEALIEFYSHGGQ